MGNLREQQSDFVKKIAILILYAYEIGYELTFGDAYASTGHKIGSYHYSRRAIDLNLFKDGKYLTSSDAHKPLGEFWEKLGGTWGGRFGESAKGKGDGQDGNHYSYGEGK